MNTTTYISPKQQQHQDGRDEQRALVDAICNSMSKPARRSKPTRTVWNVCLQQWVELR